MNRIDRLTAIILMLQSHRVLTAEQIGEHFEISVRTVYRDIAALGEAGVPIAAEAGVGYALMRGYHMPPIMFTEDEAAALFMSGEVTEQFGDDSLRKALRGALLKVRAALPNDRKDYLKRLGSSMNVSNRDLASTEVRSLMPAQEAVVRRRCMRIDYDTGGLGEVTQRVIEPLGVVFYARRWHLVAWCRLREDMRDFRLDRLRDWEVLAETFSGHDDFSLMEFIDHDIDEELLIPVVFECACWAIDSVLPDMPAKLISRSEPVDGRVRIEAGAYSLEWLTTWLLGMGSAGEALAPPELREKVAAAALEIAERHRD